MNSYIFTQLSDHEKVQLFPMVDNPTLLRAIGLYKQEVSERLQNMPTDGDDSKFRFDYRVLKEKELFILELEDFLGKIRTFCTNN